MPDHRSFLRRALLAAAVVSALASLQGCAVVAVAGVAATAAGVAVDVGVGAVKLTGKAVGAAADLVLPDKDE